ncbi:MAG: hypothetical protein MJZ16_11535, partial [Bacteroidales bacterium]|nr:hypothetical protein [Bacteroidales bacterium]
MKRQGNNGLLFWLICIVASIAAFLYFRSQFTFGFLPLFVVLIAFMLLPSAIKEYKTIATRSGEVMESRVPLLCLISSFAIIVFGSLSLYSLGNYFNPKTEVYSNYHHHAIKVEGVKINSDNFLLAGNSENAFFDSPKYRGTVRVIGHDADSVTLSFRGLFNPFYRKVTSQRHVNLNSELITFNEGERVEIVSNELDERGEYKKISFVLKTEHESKLFGLRPIDKSLFVFTENSVTDTSSFDNFLISGYSLDGITADVPLQMDIRGINIVREQINIDVKRKDIFSTYRNRGYAIELQPEANIRSIRVGDRPEVRMSTYQTRTEEVNVPYDKAFYIGLGNNTKKAFKFKKDGEDGLLLCYEMPKYQSLSASGESNSVNLMITSSIIDNENAADNESGLLDNLTDNVLQFDLFHNVGNNFNLEPFFVSYVTGPTSEIMEFSLLTPERGSSIRGVKAGERFPQVRSRNNTEWVISVENFRDTTPFKTTTLSWYLLAIIMLAAISMIFSNMSQLYVGIEYAMHLIVIAFVTIRMFLLWRVTVFPPVTSVSLYEFEHFRNMRWLNVTLICVGAYFVCINAMKFVIDYISSKRRHTARYKYSGTSSILSSYPKLTAALPFIVGGLLYFGVLVLGLSFSSPVVSVLGPTLLYLVLDAYIYKKLDKDYAENYSLEDDGKKRYGVLLLSLLNMGAASAVTIIIDGGFGIMFTMFALFSFWLKINDIYQYTDYKDKGKYPKLAQLGLLLILVGLVVSYKNIFLLLVNNVLSGISTGTFIFAAGAAVVVLLLLLCVFEILKMPLKRMAMYASIASIVVFAGIVLASAIVPEKFSNSHTAFRAKVHMQTAGEIMSEIETQTEQNKFLQASLNDWILHEYSEIGKEVNTFGEKGIGYFKIQPQSKLGAMWFAQTTDICLSRYIIAEHGKLLAWMFIIAFLALLLVSLVTPSNSRWTRIVFMQVTLILAVQALMIFLANTQAFIFFGQDFPIISLTSRLSSLYFFILAGIAICLALWGKYVFEGNTNAGPDTDAYKDIMNNNGSLKNNILWLFLLSALILAGKATVINNGKVNAKYQNIDDLSSIAYYHDRTYDVDVLLAKMNKDFENYINPAFTEYQRVNGVPKLQKNMSAFVDRAFSDSTMIADSALANCETFTKRMLEQYRSVGSKNNSRNNIVYLQYRRVYDGKLRSRDTLEFRVRNEFYKYELPSKAKDQWKGSLIERPTGELAEQSYIDQHTGYSYAYIPAEFAADGNPIQLLKVSEGTQLSLVSSDAMMMTGRQTNVVNVKPVDY